MEKNKKIKRAIRNYKEKNGREYERLIVATEFYDQLLKELTEKNNQFKRVDSSIFDFPNMEIQKNVNFNFKLLP